MSVIDSGFFESGVGPAAIQWAPLRTRFKCIPASLIVDSCLRLSRGEPTASPLVVQSLRKAPMELASFVRDQHLVDYQTKSASRYAEDKYRLENLRLFLSLKNNTEKPKRSVTRSSMYSQQIWLLSFLLPAKWRLDSNSSESSGCIPLSWGIGDRSRR